jgi:type IV pilus assembly protein PilM
MEADDKEEAVNKLINEIDYFFLTINEPRVIYVSGLAAKYPEIEAYMQLKFAARFTLIDLTPKNAINLNIETENSKLLSEYNIPFSLAYRRFEK